MDQIAQRMGASWALRTSEWIADKIAVHRQFVDMLLYGFAPLTQAFVCFVYFLKLLF